MAEESPKLYQTVLMEIRSRLQSVNVYIVLKRKFSDVNVLLNYNDFSIIIEGNVYRVPCKGINILPESLSSLQINGSHISFRFQTNNNSKDFSGRFKVELLQPPALHKYSKKDINWLKKDITYSLFCSNCLQTFCNDVNFHRVLPLPSENLDVRDWFCHGHSIDTNTDLNPNTNDVFYTETYVHLAGSLLNKNIIKSNGIVVCKRCLLWLGIVLNDIVVRVWFNTVGFKSISGIYNSSPLSDIHEVINEILSSSFLNMAKIIFHCQINNKVKNYILLWVIEKKLNILADISKGFLDCDVAKVLFRFEEKECPTILEWQKEAVTSVMSVSKSMMVVLLKHLYKMNKMLPKQFSVSNGFLVSYLCLYDKSFIE